MPHPSSNLFTSHITINHERTEVEITKYDALEKEFIKVSQLSESKDIAERMNGKLPTDYFDAPAKYHGCVINHNHFDDWLSKQPDDVVLRIISLHGKILNQKYENGSRPVFENAILEMHNTGRLPITISLKEYDTNLAKMAAALRTYLNRPGVDPELVAGYKIQLKEIEELRTLLRTRRYI